MRVYDWRLFASGALRVIQNREPSRGRQSKAERRAEQYGDDRPPRFCFRDRFDRQPRDQNDQHQNGVGKSASDEQIDKRRWPEKSPATALSIKRAFKSPPAPRQPGERAE